MIGDIGDEIGSRDTRKARHFLGDKLKPTLPLLVEGVLVVLQIEFEGFDHADDFLFAHLLAATNGVFVGTIVEESVRHKLLLAEQQTRALRTTNRFTAT